MLLFILLTDTGDDNDKIDEMHSKRRRLAAFSKLITCNIIQMSNAVEIFKNYVKVSQNKRKCYIISVLYLSIISFLKASAY